MDVDVTADSQNSGTDLHATATHPLQDVPLRNGNNNNNVDIDEIDNVAASVPVAPTEQMQTNSKANWVKFDDDVNGNAAHKNNNFSSGDSDNATRVTNAAAAELTPTTTATAAANRLSPLPPPAASAHTRPRSRTPTESKLQQQTQQLHQPRDHSPLTAPVPMQRTSTTLPDVAPAVLTTESTHVNLNASGKAQQPQQLSQQQQHHQHLQQQQQQQLHQKAKASNTTTNPHHSNNGSAAAAQPQGGSAMSKSTAAPTNHTAIPVDAAPPMRTIELSTGRIREGFANGDVIVTLLPANTKWPWITPAIFRPELVPEELMAQGLTLTVEDYVNAMETLVNDYRFTVYNICYKRILVVWIFFAFAVLLTLLFSGLQGVALFSLGVGWLFLNAAAIFLCMWVKLRLARGLEKCLARVNRQLMKHKILLVLDDRGRISCHKVNLCFMYFDASQCVNFLNEFLEHTEQNGGEAIKAGWEAKLDIDLNDIVIQGSNPVRLSRKQAVAQELFLSYLQRWGKDFLRRRLDWTIQEAGVHEIPRHLQSSICPCQYEEELLRNKIKIRLQRRRCCGVDCIGCWL